MQTNKGVSMYRPAETLSAPSTNSAFLPPESFSKTNYVCFLNAIYLYLSYIPIWKVTTDDNTNIYQ